MGGGRPSYRRMIRYTVFRNISDYIPGHTQARGHDRRRSSHASRKTALLIEDCWSRSIEVGSPDTGIEAKQERNP